MERCSAQFGTCLCDGIGFKINVFFKLFKTSGFSPLDRFNRAGMAVLFGDSFSSVECSIQDVRGALEN